MACQVDLHMVDSKPELDIEDLDAFAVQELILKLVEDHYPMPASSRAQEASASVASGRDSKRSNAVSNGQDDKSDSKPPPKRRRKQASNAGAVAESTPEPSADELVQVIALTSAPSG